MDLILGYGLALSNLLYVITKNTNPIFLHTIILNTFIFTKTFLYVIIQTSRLNTCNNLNTKS
jgi:hypothetical protein